MSGLTGSGGPAPTPWLRSGRAKPGLMGLVGVMPNPTEPLLHEPEGRLWQPTLRKLYLGGLLVACAWVIYLISRVDEWPWTCFLFLLLCLADVRIGQQPVAWSRWLPQGFVMLTIPYLLYRFAPGFWDHALSWQETYAHWI